MAAAGVSVSLSSKASYPNNVNWTSFPKKHGVTIERNIVHGTEAWVLNSKKDKSIPPSASDGDEPHLSNRVPSNIQPKSDDTHRWRVYIRALNPNDDISHFVSNVEFILHPTFAQPRVTVSNPPYEVEATGWGEFEIGIVVTFIDPTEKPVEFRHMLKLFTPDSTLPKKGKSIISEHHDQIIFVDPSEPLYNVLISNKPQEAERLEFSDPNLNGEEIINKVIAASDRVKEETTKVFHMYENSVNEAAELRRMIDALIAEKNSN